MRRSCNALKRGRIEDILRRLLRYGERVYGLKSLIGRIADGRIRPRISTGNIFASVLVMSICRLGSINGLVNTKKHSFWKRWLKAEPASHSSIGRVYTRLVCDSIRSGIHHLYMTLKRNKALKPVHGKFLLLIDGHETNTSYRRCCRQCLRRVVHSREKDRIQYYHRNVTAMLVSERMNLPLDAEPQLPGEDEVAAATRLLRRIYNGYPRAFDVVVVDGLYARAPFFKLVTGINKQIIAVLKDERRELLIDARALFNLEKPEMRTRGKTTYKVWDIEEMTTWEKLKEPVRVVRSLETTVARFQMMNKEEVSVSDWVWVTTVPKKSVPAWEIVQMAHSRWLIENNGFNELVNQWHADHVYKHHPTAIMAFWLTILFAYILFHAFVLLNLKPQIRVKHTVVYWVKILAAELYYIPLQPG